MKMIKSVLLICVLAIFTLNVTSCKKKCKTEAPQARILNNGTFKVSVQIKTSNGNTVNINNVDPSSASAYASYAPGDITFTISVNNDEPYVKVVSMGNCNYYDIAIDKDNNITTAITAREYIKE